MPLDDHPDVIRYRERAGQPAETQVLDAAWLKNLCLECGADDAGFAAISRPEIVTQAMQAQSLMPGVKTLVALVCRMNRPAVMSPVRSVANNEFHETYDAVNHAARRLVARLRDEGIEAMNAVAAFPMEAQDFPGKTFVLQHKPIAEAAGMGRMGLHRNVIHPKFGNFILLDTVLLGAEVSEESQPVDYNPCIDCKLCVAACPVEAIGQDGSFNFSACYTHNYRDFLGGFTDWVDQVVEADGRDDYRRRIDEGETVAMWQSLSFKPSYKAAYCVSVCPAGEDVLGSFLPDRMAYNREVVQPLKDKKEPVYVLPRSDAEESVPRRYPHKQAKRVQWTVNARDVYSFLFNLTLTFQRRRSRNMRVVCNVKLSGDLPVEASIRIADQKLVVDFAPAETADLTVTANAEDFMAAFRHDSDVADMIESGKIEVDGSADRFAAMVECFAGYGYLAPETVAL